MQTRYLGVLLLLGAVWGASFLFIKLGVQDFPPPTLVAIRLSVAALVLLAVLYARGLRLPRRARAWGDFLLTGCVGLVLPFVLITWGETSIPSNMAAILNATTPLFTVLLAYIWTGEERLSGLRLLGVVLGFVGVLVVVGIADISLASTSTRGQLAVLVASLCYGISNTYSRRAFRGLPPLIPATGQLLAGALVITPLALATQGIPAAPAPLAIGAVLTLAVFGTAMSNILLYWLLEHVGATRTSMVTYLLPPFALLYGALFLRESITMNTILGLALVVAGILLANGALRWPAKSAALEPRTKN
jgi:drug/metabolite transporter (DMT)-like permease